LNAENVRQGDHLGHRRIGDGTVPDFLHFLLSEVSQAHAGDLSVRVLLPSSVVLDCLEEDIEPLRQALAVVRWLYCSDPLIEVSTFLKPKLWGKPMAFAIAASFS
jgi:hypothetical protein